jgi:hypothetical protein
MGSALSDGKPCPVFAHVCPLAEHKWSHDCQLCERRYLTPVKMKQFYMVYKFGVFKVSVNIFVCFQTQFCSDLRSIIMERCTEFVKITRSHIIITNILFAFGE